MKQYLHRDGKFVTLTTRRNHATSGFTGKFTFWPSELVYRMGDCNGAMTFTAVYLGDISTMPGAIEEFIDSVLKAVKKQEGQDATAPTPKGHV